MGVPYVIVKGKARLGTVVHKKGAAVVALQDVKKEDERDLSNLVSAAKANLYVPLSFLFLIDHLIPLISTDKYEEHKRVWGGGLRGNKSTQKLRKRAKEAGQDVKAAHLNKL